MQQVAAREVTAPMAMTPVAEGEARQKLAVRCSGLTDTGRVRPGNEDAFLIAELTKALRVRQSSLQPPTTHYSDERGFLLLVADGMGGARAGEQASALAVGTLEDFALNTLKWFYHLQSAEEDTVIQEFKSAVKAADDRIFFESARHPEWRGMGTTLTMAYTLGTDLFVLHVGDSRCYLFRQGQLHQITMDHTLVGELVRQGTIKPEQARRHHLRHVITNAIGGTERGIRVEAHKIELEPGDRVLLCTDGLTEMVPDPDIAAALAAQGEPAAVCQRLVSSANERGGKDNITVLVARFEAPGAAPQNGGS